MNPKELPKSVASISTAKAEYPDGRVFVAVDSKYRPKRRVRLLSIKELAAALPKGPKGKERTRRYVYAMLHAGFIMRKRRTTLTQALQWLRRNKGKLWE